MPGYEPFLLCDFHVHTTWSDGRLSIREVVDLYGRTGHFDVIAITDHILMKRDLLARAARLASLGRRQFSVSEDRFDAYLADIGAEAKRARKLYDLLVIPGVEITQNHIRSKRNSHIVALNVQRYVGTSQAGRRARRSLGGGESRRPVFGHQPETLPLRGEQRFSQPKHLYSWKTLLRCEKEWDAIARTLRANVDVALTLYRNGSWAA